jgi:hypothetical protein
MPKQLLHGANIIPALQEMGSKTVAKAMVTRRLGHPRSADRFFDRVLQVSFRRVVAPFLATARIDGDLFGGKDRRRWGSDHYSKGFTEG